MSQLCGCRGARTCLLCEGKKERLARTDPDTSSNSLYQCHNCGKIGSLGDCPEDPVLRPLHTCRDLCRAATVLYSSSSPVQQPDTSVDRLEGVTVVKGFISQEEEAAILLAVDSHHWTDSQSGRRKQDYGPKVNFKRRKLKLGVFSGLPPFIEPLVKRMRECVDVLDDFTPVELCNLDYHPERGAHIVAHRDDSWLWGERLVTVNLLSPTLLTFTCPPPSSPPSSNHLPPQPLPPPTNIHIPLPPRSLVVVQGPARHMWLHSILRTHIISRRVGITLRELSNIFMESDEAKETGQLVLKIAQQYSGLPTNVVT